MVSAMANPSDAFRAVSCPTRRRILDLLAAGERTVGELVRALGISQPSVSQQVRTLVESGLVEQRAEGRKRICVLRAEPLAAVHDWVAHYERFWSARLDALGGVLDEVGGVGEEGARDDQA